MSADYTDQHFGIEINQLELESHPMGRHAHEFS